MWLIEPQLCRWDCAADTMGSFMPSTLGFVGSKFCDYQSDGKKQFSLLTRTEYKYNLPVVMASLVQPADRSFFLFFLPARSIWGLHNCSVLHTVSTGLPR